LSGERLYYYKPYMCARVYRVFTRYKPLTAQNGKEDSPAWKEDSRATIRLYGGAK